MNLNRLSSTQSTSAMESEGSRNLSTSNFPKNINQMSHFSWSKEVSSIADCPVLSLLSACFFFT